MKIERPFFANIAAIQYTYWFNCKYQTDISIRIEHKEGVPFAIISSDQINRDLIFEFAYRLGEIQAELTAKKVYTLAFDKFPLPPKNEGLYYWD